MEQKLFPDWRGLVLLGAGLLYLLATPGIFTSSLLVQAPNLLPCLHETVRCLFPL